MFYQTGMEDPLIMRRVRRITVPADKIFGHRLKEDINSFFKFELDRLSKIENDLREKNLKLMGPVSGKLVTIKGPFSSVIYHPSLKEETESWKKTYDKLIKDIQSVTNLFSAAAVRCKNEQDYRNAFPDELWDSNDPILQWERTEDPGFMLKDFKVLYRQFNQGVDILLYYQFNKLVF